MKELSIEQKAARFDAALRVIKTNLEALNEIAETGAEIVNIQAMKNCFYRAFPELKEDGDEDERIKNEIIAFVEQSIHRGGGTPIPEKQENKWIAWIEKQGKKNSEEEVDNLHNYLYCEKNSAWSKEDDYVIERLFSLLDNEQDNYPQLSSDFQEIEEIKNRLKFFKERVQIQPRQGWSEEDRGNLLAVKGVIDKVWHNQYIREEIARSGEELESLWHWLDNI